MTDSTEQNTNPTEDPYLESPKTFHLEMPPYHDFDLTIDVTIRKIYERLSYHGTIDAYCIWCKREGVFNALQHFQIVPVIPNVSDTVHSLEDQSLGARVLIGIRSNMKNGLIPIKYQCTRNNTHTYHIYYFRKGNLFTKVGQFPSVADFQMPQAGKYRNILGEIQYKELTRGIGLKAHGVGIGSFVYLRRVFENLIKEAHKEAVAENKEFPKNHYQQARMDEKIDMVKDYLPAFLVENQGLYAILSKGIHELTENECLQYFDAVKTGIELILDEKITQKEKELKMTRAREEFQKIQKIHSNPTNLK